MEWIKINLSFLESLFSADIVNSIHLHWQGCPNLGVNLYVSIYTEERVLCTTGNRERLYLCPDSSGPKMATAQNLPQFFSFPPYQTESAEPPLQGPYTFMCMYKEEKSNFPNTISVIRMCGCALWPLRLPSLNPTTYNYIILKLHNQIELELPLTPADVLWKPGSDSHRCISE